MAGSDARELARHALEQVCSGSDPSAAVGVYSPNFHDHVNAAEYRGRDGIRQSLGLYQLVFSDGDLRIRVEDQITEGERIASRWARSKRPAFAGSSASGGPEGTETGRLAPVLWFFALAYALSWAWWVTVALSQPAVQRGDGWPTHVPGLLGPMLAAFLVLALTEGSRGVRELLAAMVRWPHRLRWQLAVVSPLIFLVLALPAAAVLGGFPSLDEFGRLSGAASGVVGVGLVLLINGYGEETGWRGYARPRLQARFGALRATSYVALGWAGWHCSSCSPATPISGRWRRSAS